jgi:hypothetical protein
VVAAEASIEGFAATSCRHACHGLIVSEFCPVFGRRAIPWRDNFVRNWDNRDMAVKKCRECGFEFVLRYSGPGRPRERCYSCQPEGTKWVGGTKKGDKDGRELSQGARAA